MISRDPECKESYVACQRSIFVKCRSQGQLVKTCISHFSLIIFEVKYTQTKKNSFKETISVISRDPECKEIYVAFQP